MSLILKVLAVLVLAIVAAAPVWATQFAMTGKVVYVDDGDTLVLLVDGREQRKVRLASIDAPETSHTGQEKGRIGQPYSANSGRYLATLVKGKQVEARCFEADRYGRYVCDIFLDGRSVNREMVTQGWAWANVSARGRYLRDKSLVGLQESARAGRTGLWAGLNPVEPWVWRKQCWQMGECKS